MYESDSLVAEFAKTQSDMAGRLNSGLRRAQSSRKFNYDKKEARGHRRRLKKNIPLINSWPGD
jgi:hypothetical protein